MNCNTSSLTVLTFNTFKNTWFITTNSVKQHRKEHFQLTRERKFYRSKIRIKWQSTLPWPVARFPKTLWASNINDILQFLSEEWFFFFHGTSIIQDFLFFLDVAVTLNYWVTVATSTSTLSDTIAIGVRVMSIPHWVIFIGGNGCHVIGIACVMVVTY